MRFDETDRQILEILQTQGRITNTRLASMVGLSQPAMLGRVRRLEEFGIVQGYHAILDREKIGLEVLAFVLVCVAEHLSAPVENVKKKIAELPEVLECYQVSGDDDLILKVALEDIRCYTDWVMNKLAAISGIRKIKTTFVLSTVKKSNMYNLDLLVGEAD
jgi:Lrp/AsnC family leucine-responsive transcriptional regulator